MTFKLNCGLSGQEGEEGHSRQSKARELRQRKRKRTQHAVEIANSSVGPQLSGCEGTARDDEIRPKPK